MKKIKIYFCFSLILFYVIQLDLIAQMKEIPVTTSSKDALNFFLQGRDKFENQEVVSAASLFDKAIEKDPSFALAYLYRSQSGGGFNVLKQNLDKAVSLVGNVSEGEKLEILYSQAFMDRKGPKQKEYLDQLLISFPSDKRVHELAGEYYYFINEFQNALVHFKKASDLDNKYAPVYNMLGYCESALSNYQEAEKAYQTYIQLVPNNPNPYDSYAELLLKLGKYDESILQYKKALEKDPSFTTSIAGIGNNYIFKQDYSTARKFYQEYFEKSTAIGGKLDALFQKAVTFIYEGKQTEAAGVFDEYRALAEKENLIPNLINSYANQGFTISESGKPSEALKYFDKATDLIGKSNLPETTKENLATNSMLWHLYLLTATNDLEKATAESEKCKIKIESRKNPGEIMFLNSLLGLLELKKGNWNKSIKYFSEADNTDPWTWYYTALAYSKKGDKENSAKLFDKITKWNVNSLSLALVRKPAMEELKN